MIALPKETDCSYNHKNFVSIRTFQADLAESLTWNISMYKNNAMTQVLTGSYEKCQSTSSMAQYARHLNLYLFLLSFIWSSYMKIYYVLMDSCIYFKLTSNILDQIEYFFLQQNNFPIFLNFVI